MTIVWHTQSICIGWNNEQFTWTKNEQWNKEWTMEQRMSNGNFCQIEQDIVLGFADVREIYFFLRFSCLYTFSLHNYFILCVWWKWIVWKHCMGVRAYCTCIIYESLRIICENVGIFISVLLNMLCVYSMHFNYGIYILKTGACFYLIKNI